MPARHSLCLESLLDSGAVTVAGSDAPVEAGVHVSNSMQPSPVADFTVFSSDRTTIPDPEILRARVTMTVIGGEIAYSAF